MNRASLKCPNADQIRSCFCGMAEHSSAFAKNRRRRLPPENHCPLVLQWRAYYTFGDHARMVTTLVGLPQGPRLYTGAHKPQKHGAPSGVV
ncbi:hypothetical protein T265_03847 [Opisthorchis viverrini]|uniref:Uncharacterized protein n=1 Tax=Opisthorchis viverrini TaxID=6198 RepID=A0A074ZQ48_OPIVI|nr:hypothetical protein T265_03847 [Opisthorchis viverrini]KER29548.1 hypothetical protein T265_03847 [Opisthorchis viverrini]